jgi:hypothetical protein
VRAGDTSGWTLIQPTSASPQAFGVSGFEGQSLFQAWGSTSPGIPPEALRSWEAGS